MSTMKGNDRGAKLAGSTFIGADGDTDPIRLAIARLRMCPSTVSITLNPAILSIPGTIIHLPRSPILHHAHWCPHSANQYHGRLFLFAGACKSHVPPPSIHFFLLHRPPNPNPLFSNGHLPPGESPQRSSSLRQGGGQLVCRLPMHCVR